MCPGVSHVKAPVSNERKEETPKALSGVCLLLVLFEVKMVSAHWLMFFSRAQFLVLMYLVTYLGRLCNGLTVLIVGKEAETWPACLLYVR